MIRALRKMNADFNGNSNRATRVVSRPARVIGLLGCVAILVSLAGCSKHSDPNFIYMPDMVYTPAMKAQKPGSMRVPPAGTIPRDHNLTDIPDDAEEAGRVLKNPLPRTLANLKKGQEFYNVYCIVCHGPKGLGDGPVTPLFPNPPSLISDKVRDLSDGRLFHIMSRGQNLMPSYATQINEEERWAIAHYLRALYRAAHPTSEDLKKSETW